MAIGDPNVATGTGAVALGADNTATGTGAVAIGNLNSAVGNGAIALGNAASANGAGAVAIGNGAVATMDGQVALGGSDSTYTFAGLNSAESAARQSGPVSLVTTDAAGNLGAGQFGHAARGHDGCFLQRRQEYCRAGRRGGRVLIA
mgnify:FL=1